MPRRSSGLQEKATYNGRGAIMLHLTAVLAVPLATVAVAAPPPHHRLSVVLTPETHRVEVRDVLTPPPGDSVQFVLHAGLQPRTVTPGWRLAAVDGPVAAAFGGINATTATVVHTAPLESYRLLRGQQAPEQVEVVYGGSIYHPLVTPDEEYQRSFSETAGIVDPQGVFLAGISFWVPTFGDALVTFELEVTSAPTGWRSVSQGRRTRSEGRERWVCERPVEEVYLVAGPWTEVREQAGPVELMAFLRTPDPLLARRYLDATKRYLALYESMLPAFPWPSFALVENFWETGYGMPGFTLLGPKVIRFPWILTSSYPHELLHNWWGNSVYVAAEGGNWCEGLTTYMADHLLAEQRGEGVGYRRDTLRKYSDFVRDGKDFPLSEFGSRTSAATEAVGYGKSLMLFHMLRQDVGDATFLAGLTRFWRKHANQRASFADLEAAFEAETGTSRRTFFATWVSRPGAPRLAIAAAVVRELPDGAGYQLELTLEQTQPEEPFPLRVPVLITVTEGPAIAAVVQMAGRKASAIVPLLSRPIRLDVDPGFDIMRRLDPAELPPTLSTVLGDDRPSYVLPAGAGEGELAAWRDLVSVWQKGKGDGHLVMDSELTVLPEGNVWVLGWSNRFVGAVLERLAGEGVKVTSETVAVGHEQLAKSDLSLALVARHPGGSGQAVALLAASSPAAIPGLGRKLPHYSKYGYLGFRGAAPENVAKGIWAATGSPLVRSLTDGPLPELRLPRREPLAKLPPVFDGSRMVRTVAWLADPAREGRGLGTPGLAAATDWVESAMREAGLRPGQNAAFRQDFEWKGGKPERKMVLTNLVGVVPGSDPRLAPVLVMAHLDHLGHGWPDVRAGNEGRVHPGADDNASGVAVLLELARHFAAQPPSSRRLLFAVVTGEEAGKLGSQHLLAGMAAGELPVACLNLDTVGRLDAGTLYVLGSDSAREGPFVFLGAGATTGVPVAIVAEQLDASDQVSCLAHGVPAVQLFSGPNADYHRPSDTVDKLDAAGLVKVAAVAAEVVSYLGGRRDPLTTTLGQASAAPIAPPPTGGQRASLGTMPDFGFQGPGVRVAQVTPDSPAERAGIAVGDVLLAIGEQRLSGLADLSAALRTRRPGETVTVTLARGDQELQPQVTLGAR
ncbi:MAG: M20/M25/M40 family metallo-hydrolase [Acidobacteriota bacterium]|nr:M20/M25/M40 family metallo-hydrolase [Acidobacteriota bacterium]